jgi:hypothetical protein
LNYVVVETRGKLKPTTAIRTPTTRLLLGRLLSYLRRIYGMIRRID